MVKRLAWISDPHFNFVSRNITWELGAECAAVADACVITGDISEAHDMLAKLALFQDGFQRKQIFFVLGNHDFYHSSFTGVRARLAPFATGDCVWLNASDARWIAEDVQLVGVDGWYDAQLGRPHDSNVFLSDWKLIDEFREALFVGKVVDLARELGQESAVLAKEKLAATKAKRVIFATHVPPFREASTYGGKISNDDYLPWFTNKALGFVLREWALANPEREMLVICGHSHGGSAYQELPNLLVKTASVEYYKPAIAEVFEL